MAKNKKTVKTQDEPGKKLINHMQSMKMWSLEQYYQWCREHNFAASFKKSDKQIDEEIRYNQALYEERMYYAAIDKNPRKLIQHLCDGLIDSKKIQRPFWSEFAAAIENSPQDSNSNLTPGPGSTLPRDSNSNLTSG